MMPEKYDMCCGHNSNAEKVSLTIQKIIDSVKFE